MRARIGIAMGTYWGGMVYAIDVISTITALGAVGGLPALLSVLINYARFAIRWLQGGQLRTTTTSVAIHALCNKARIQCNSDFQLLACQRVVVDQ